MFNSSSITLNPLELTQTLNRVSPFVLSINPQFTDPLSKSYKIVYDFNDGTPTITKILKATPYQKNDLLKFPYEITDPRNEIVSHTFILQKETSKTFYINVKVYSVMDAIIGSGETPNYSEFIITLHLQAPILDTKSIELSSNFFEEIHLLNSRMFDLDNTLLYNFESSNPHYLLPTVVKWHDPFNNLNTAPFLFDPEYSPRGRYPR